MKAVVSISFASLRLVGGCVCGNSKLRPRRSVRRYFLTDRLYFESSPNDGDIYNGSHQGHHLIGLDQLDKYTKR